ncbi:MAG: putative quinol monooxygenase [Acidimicrobiales bacterium]|jgi:quinol monooxygenase YgiN
MSNQVAIFATLRAVEGKGEEVESAALAGLQAVSDEEGTELYIVHRSAEDPDIVRLYELYRDSEAQAAHMSGQALREIGKSLKGLLAGAPELVIVPVAGGSGI